MQLGVESLNDVSRNFPFVGKSSKVVQLNVNLKTQLKKLLHGKWRQSSTDLHFQKACKRKKLLGVIKRISRLEIGAGILIMIDSQRDGSMLD